jgi:hypothetical protein
MTYLSADRFLFARFFFVKRLCLTHTGRHARVKGKYELGGAEKWLQAHE